MSEPASGCATKRECTPLGWMERCDICQRQFAFREGMTWDAYTEWRSFVLDTHYHPENYTEGVDYIAVELPSPVLMPDNDNATGVVSRS